MPPYLSMLPCLAFGHRFAQHTLFYCVAITRGSRTAVITFHTTAVVYRYGSRCCLRIWLCIDQLGSVPHSPPRMTQHFFSHAVRLRAFYVQLTLRSHALPRCCTVCTLPWFWCLVAALPLPVLTITGRTYAQLVNPLAVGQRFYAFPDALDPAYMDYSWLYLCRLPCAGNHTFTDRVATFYAYAAYIRPGCCRYLCWFRLGSITIPGSP